jgi:hypothetical protein
MAATGQDARIKRAGSYDLAIAVTDADGAVDLTGKALFYRVAKQPGARVDLLQLASPDAITIDGSTATVHLTTERTLGLKPSEYYHELFAVEAGERHILTTGKLTVVPTQAALYEEAA